MILRREYFLKFLQSISHFALGAVVVTLPFRLRLAWVARPVPPLYYEYTDFALYASDIFILLAVLSWGMMVFLQGESINVGPPAITLPILGLTILGGVSVIFSVDPGLSAYHFLRICLLGGVYLMVVNTLITVRQIAVPFAISVFLESSIGFFQSVRQESVGLAVFGEISVRAEEGAAVLFGPNGVFLRAYGLTDHPNILGGVLAVGLLVVLGWLFIENRVTLPWGFLLGLGAAGCVLSLSRSGWLAFAGGGLVLLLYRQLHFGDVLRRTHWPAYLTAAGVVILLSFHAAPLVAFRMGVTLPEKQKSMPRSEGGGDPIFMPPAVADRMNLNIAAGALITDNPLTGVGLGAFPLALRETYAQFPQRYSHVHVVALDAAAEAGVAAGVLFIWLAAAPLFLFLKHARKRPASMGLAIATAALLAITIVGLFDHYPWSQHTGRGLLWVFWGLWAGFYVREGGGWDLKGVNNSLGKPHIPRKRHIPR